jgi:Copper chaperone
MTTVLTVPDMSCGHCKTTLEDALTSIRGVEIVRVDLDAKTVTVDHADGLDEAALREAVVEAGYAVTEVAR